MIFSISVILHMEPFDYRRKDHNMALVARVQQCVLNALQDAATLNVHEGARVMVRRGYEYSTPSFCRKIRSVHASVHACARDFLLFTSRCTYLITCVPYVSQHPGAKADFLAAKAALLSGSRAKVASGEPASVFLQCLAERICNIFTGGCVCEQL